MCRKSEDGCSFRFLVTLRGSCLGSGGNLIITRTILVLAMLWEVLAVIKVAIGVIIVSVLGSELVHLLRTGSKLVWATIPSPSH